MANERITNVMERAARDGTVPGAIAVAGGPTGVLYEKAFGRLSVDGDEPASATTMIWLASLTKAITCVAALQLLEGGRIGLEQPVGSVLPAFADVPVLEGFDRDTPRLRSAARPVTVRHLLTHTAGLAYSWTNVGLRRYCELAGIDPMSGTRAALYVPLVADPGTRWVYGIGTDWLGQLVEAVSGVDLASYCRQRIFDPLGMVDAIFSPGAAQLARLMPMHVRTPDGGLAPRPLRFGEPEFAAGGHGLFATAGDYLRFMRALLRGGELDGERILRPESVELAFTDHVNGVPLGALRWRTAAPELSNDVPWPPFARGWGLGFQVTLDDVPGMRRAGTVDWAGLGNCYYWIDRASGVAAALLTQVLPFYDARVVATAAEFERAVYAEVGGR